MAMIPNPESTITIPATSTRFLSQDSAGDRTQGRLRYLTGGGGPPLVMLHTVRTQAEQFRRMIPLVQPHYTIYALDLPGMGYSEIVRGAAYEEPALRAGVKRLITALDLEDVTLLGESIGAVLALTTAADLPDRIRQVIAVNPYDYRGGIKRSGVLARAIVSGVIAPGVGPRLAKLEPKPVMRSILRGGLVDKTALSEDYLNELLNVGQRPGYPTVARAIYRNLPTMIAARDRYRAVKAPVHLIYGAQDWSRRSDREANQRQLPNADYTEVANAGHFIALERPDVPADLLASLA